jgi:hypothetical protein
MWRWNLTAHRRRTALVPTALVVCLVSVAVPAGSTAPVDARAPAPDVALSAAGETTTVTATPSPVAEPRP